MWKYNKYNIGDIVGHKETPDLKFRIIDVLCGVPEKKGTYGYAHHQIFDDDRNNMEDVFLGIDSDIYLEKDLFLIRNPTRKELNKMLKEAQAQEKRFNSIATTIRNKINGLKP